MQMRSSISRILINENIDRRIEELRIDDEKILIDLEDEDVFLILTASAKKLDYLITYNRYKNYDNIDKKIYKEK